MLVEEEDDLLIELVADRVESLCGYKPEPDWVAEFLSRQVAQQRPGSGTPTPSPVAPGAASQVGRTAAAGFSFSLEGHEFQCRTARDVLVSVFEELIRRDSKFPERFASLARHGRTRRYLARNRDELYPDRPDLVANYSHQLSCGWWIGVNISRKQVERIIRMACGVTSFQLGHDLVIQLGN